MRIARAAVLFVLAAFLMGPGSRVCMAHPGNLSSALAKVGTDGAFHIQLRFDLLAYALLELPNHGSEAAMNALLDGPPADLESRLREARERFRRNFRAGPGGGGTIDSLAFPDAAAVLQSVRKDSRSRLPVLGSVTVSGHLPPGVRTAAFRFDEALGPLVLTTEFPYQEPVSEPVDAGAFSREQPIPTAESVAKVAESYRAPTAASSSPSPFLPKRTAPAPKARRPPSAKPKPSPSPTPSAPLPSPSPSPSGTPAVAVTPSPPASPAPARVTPAPSPSAAVVGPVPSTTALPVAAQTPPELPAPSASRGWMNLFQYGKMGYTHILPHGIDHILFVLGLFLLSVRTKSLLQQVTAFTVAHSLTLALSLYGIVHLPAAFVEPVIAASIAFVAIENLFSTEMKPSRLAVVFGFGLIHGLGFAEALQGLGLRTGDLLTALVGFNVGVEMGQLSVVAAAFVLVGRFRDHPHYRKFVVLPGSFAIAVTALFWMFQRMG